MVAQTLELAIPTPCNLRFITEWDETRYGHFRLDDFPTNWPKTVGEIGNGGLRMVLNQVNERAVGGSSTLEWHLKNISCCGQRVF
jgi:hypothetical protein